MSVTAQQSQITTQYGAVPFPEAINKTFDTFDKDGDGFITKEEMTTLYRGVFGSGTLNFQLTTALIDTLYRRHDLDGDGKVSRLDFQKSCQQFFNN